MLCDDLEGWGRWEEVQEGGDIRTHTADSLCCTTETNTTLSNNYTPIKKRPRETQQTHIYLNSQEMSPKNLSKE